MFRTFYDTFNHLMMFKKKIIISKAYYSPDIYQSHRVLTTQSREGLRKILIESECYLERNMSCFPASIHAENIYNFFFQIIKWSKVSQKVSNHNFFFWFSIPHFFLLYTFGAQRIFISEWPLTR